MELKKSSKADLERKRIYFFLTGLFISSGLLYLVLEWKFVSVPNDDLDSFITLEEEIDIQEENFIMPEEDVVEINTPSMLIPVPQMPVAVEIFDVVENLTPVKPLEIVSWEDLSDEDMQNLLEQEALALDQASATDELIFTQVEEMPEFPGGEQAFILYLTSHVRYLPNARIKGISGQVVCSFVINKEGKVSEVTVIKGLETSLDMESVRVIKSMPDWKPGKNKNKPVSVKYIIPITFKT
jgi:protein TonB